jgi:hypothetical protein
VRKRVPKGFVLALLAMLTGGCVVTGKYVRTGDRQLEPLPAGCPFAIYTAVPPAGAVEVGLVEYWNAWDGSGAGDLQEARDIAAPYVCSAGGDGLVAYTSDSRGRIPKATIIKRAKASTPAKVAP